MSRIFISHLSEKIGQEVIICGWVHQRRNMGKLVFVDIRDRTGVIQVVLGNDLTQGNDQVKDLRPEFVVRIQGIVATRRGANLPTGLPALEIQAKQLIVLNQAKTPPFEIVSEERQANEELRMKYRYLDLRHERMQRNLTLRHNISHFLREYLVNQDFIEVETPYLTKGTPEGAREYIVPVRQFPGEFYTLPQSPQQFKQLLMVGGIERYFQFARCFRDEDTRGDRQPEFTQLDLEMSFVDVEEVLQLVEDMCTTMVNVVLPDYHLTKTPFPRLTYDEVMKRYRTDRPDIRQHPDDPKELGFCFIVDFPLFEHSESEKKLVPVHHLFTSPKDADLPLLSSDPAKAHSKQYDLVLNGFEIAGGSIRIHQTEVQQQVFEVLQLKAQEVQKRFGHMLEAFAYGAPPHGGIAVGFDRLIAVLANEPNIREVIAFPKTSDGRDLMMGAPSSLPDTQLTEAHISIMAGGRR